MGFIAFVLGRRKWSEDLAWITRTYPEIANGRGAW